MEGGRKTCDPNRNLSEGQTAVSVIHSHGSYFWWHEDDSPSSADMKSAGDNTDYVVTPLGNMYSYNKDGVIETVRKDLPRDPFADDYNATYDEFKRKYLHPDPYIDHYTKRITTIYQGEYK